MHLEGTHVLAAPRQEVWNMLLDPEVLARVTPGVSGLDPLGDYLRARTPLLDHRR